MLPALDRGRNGVRQIAPRIGGHSGFDGREYRGFRSADSGEGRGWKVRSKSTPLVRPEVNEWDAPTSARMEQELAEEELYFRGASGGAGGTHFQTQGREPAGVWRPSAETFQQACTPRRALCYTSRSSQTQPCLAFPHHPLKGNGAGQGGGRRHAKSKTDGDPARRKNRISEYDKALFSQVLPHWLRVAPAPERCEQGSQRRAGLTLSVRCPPHWPCGLTAPRGSADPTRRECLTPCRTLMRGGAASAASATSASTCTVRPRHKGPALRRATRPGVKDAACPISTRGGTRRVRLVRGRRGSPGRG